MTSPVFPETDEYVATWTHEPPAAEPVDQMSDPYADDEPLTEEVPVTGVTGGTVALLAVLVTLGCVGLNALFTGGLSFFFDLCFVVICLVAAMAVDKQDMFTVGVLSPLIFGLAVGVLAVLDPGSLAAASGRAQAFLIGLTDHAGALVAGYALALVTLGVRWTNRHP